MLELAFPAKQDDDVILKVRLRCRACFVESFPLVPISRQPAGRSECVVFMAGRMWERMPFLCSCGHTAADLVKVDYPTDEDIPRARPEPVQVPMLTVVATATPEPEVRPSPFPNLGLPRLLRCG